MRNPNLKYALILQSIGVPSACSVSLTPELLSALLLITSESQRHKPFVPGFCRGFNSRPSILVFLSLKTRHQAHVSWVSVFISRGRTHHPLTHLCLISNSGRRNRMYPELKVKFKVEEGKEEDNQPGSKESKRSFLLSLKDLDLLSLQGSYSPVFNRFCTGKLKEQVMQPLISPSSVAKVPKNYVPKSVVFPSIHASKGLQKNGQTENNQMQNLRTENGLMENCPLANSRMENRQTESGQIENCRTENGRTENHLTDNSRSGNHQTGCEDNRANIRASFTSRPRAVLSSPDNDVLIGKKNRSRSVSPSLLKNQSPVPSRRSQCKVISGSVGMENHTNTRKSRYDSDCMSERVGRPSSEVGISSSRVSPRPKRPSSVRL